jgi:hypothetical protein
LILVHAGSPACGRIDSLVLEPAKKPLIRGIYKPDMTTISMTSVMVPLLFFQVKMGDVMAPSPGKVKI